MDEKDVLRVAKFYEDTRVWRKELRLTGYLVESRLTGSDILWVETEDRNNAWCVAILVLGPRSFRVTGYRPEGDDLHGVELNTSEQVMEHIDKELKAL